LLIYRSRLFQNDIVQISASWEFSVLLNEFGKFLPYFNMIKKEMVGINNGKRMIIERDKDLLLLNKIFFDF
jgi:hypothetical protein